MNKNLAGRIIPTALTFLITKKSNYTLKNLTRKIANYKSLANKFTTHLLRNSIWNALERKRIKIKVACLKLAEIPVGD